MPEIQREPGDHSRLDEAYSHCYPRQCEPPREIAHHVHHFSSWHKFCLFRRERKQFCCATSELRESESCFSHRATEPPFSRASFNFLFARTMRLFIVSHSWMVEDRSYPPASWRGGRQDFFLLHFFFRSEGDWLAPERAVGKEVCKDVTRATAASFSGLEGRPPVYAWLTFLRVNECVRSKRGLLVAAALQA